MSLVSLSPSVYYLTNEGGVQGPWIPLHYRVYLILLPSAESWEFPAWHLMYFPPLSPYTLCFAAFPHSLPAGRQHEVNLFVSYGPAFRGSSPGQFIRVG